MTTKTFSQALGEIGDKYITEANEYVAVSKKFRWNWKAVAACVAVAILFFGAIPFLHNNTNAPIGSPFVLTAYAVDVDNTISAVEMKEGENIPVSFFEANNGLKGFVFSHRATNSQNHVSFSIMTDGSQATIGQQIEAINGLELSKDNIYVFYIPAQDQPSPYSVPLTIEDEASNSIALLNVVGEKTEDGYIARIDNIAIYEKTNEPEK